MIFPKLRKKVFLEFSNPFLQNFKTSLINLQEFNPLPWSVFGVKGLPSGFFVSGGSLSLYSFPCQKEFDAFKETDPLPVEACWMAFSFRLESKMTPFWVRVQKKEPFFTS